MVNQDKGLRKFVKPKGILATKIDTGLSPFQRQILRRERIMKLLRQTPPMDRARVLNKASTFQRQLSEIRSDKLPVRSGLIPISESKVQQAQLRFKQKLLSKRRI